MKIPDVLFALNYISDHYAGKAVHSVAVCRNVSAGVDARFVKKKRSVRTLASHFVKSRFGKKTCYPA